jgi:RNA polymerase sigma-70 factor (ECF subfamily)
VADLTVGRSSFADQDVTDEALIEAAQQDVLAFERLYLRYQDRVFAYVRARTASAEDAADLTQQVFMQAFVALPRFRSRGAPFAAWLFKIARNTANKYYRGRRDAVTWDLLPVALHPFAAEGVEAAFLQKETALWLKEVLETCSTGTREMLVLHFGSGLTISETAAVVGKSEAAVKKQIFRTVRALRETYDDPR